MAIRSTSVGKVYEELAVDELIRFAVARRARVLTARDAEYTTAKPLIEQGYEDNLLEDFDARLKKGKDDGGRS